MPARWAGTRRVLEHWDERLPAGLHTPTASVDSAAIDVGSLTAGTFTLGDRTWDLRVAVADRLDAIVERFMTAADAAADRLESSS